jgi:hypothetical protein
MWTMAKLVAREDYLNSPTYGFITGMIIALAEGDAAFLADHMTDDFTWTMIGEAQVQGKANFLNTLDLLATERPAELAIRKIITSDSDAAVSGEVTMNDGKKYGFCDVYEFSSVNSTQVKSISSYIVGLKA